MNAMAEEGDRKAQRVLKL
ncbi:hypothetical protein, partial [Jeotgalibaca porci]